MLRKRGKATDFAFRLPESGNVTRRGKYADDLAGFVAIDGCVVEDGNTGPVAAPDVERVVAHEALPERPLIAGARLRRVGEIVGEIGTDEFCSGAAGDRLGGGVHVGDLAVASDGDERVETGFDQSAVIGARQLCVLFSRSPPLRRVALRGRKARRPSPR